MKSLPETSLSKLEMEVETTTTQSSTNAQKRDNESNSPVEQRPLSKLKRSSIDLGEMQQLTSLSSAKKIQSFPTLPVSGPISQASYFTFCLQKQPLEIQRRSYASETR